MAAACFNVMQSMPRMGIAVIGMIDAELHAILGDRGAAIQSLRSAVNAGWAYYWLRPFESNNNFESLSDGQLARQLDGLASVQFDLAL